jgi:hypothetical protein
MRVLYPDERMKQAQLESTRYLTADRWRFHDRATSGSPQRTDQPRGPTAPVIKQSNAWLWRELLASSITAFWFVVTLPFRLIFWLIAWLGRLTAVLLGFALMVVGMALWAGPLFFVGIPLFLVGLVLTLRCLD